MKLKRIISLLMVFAMCLGFSILPAGADSNDVSGVEELYALGILDSLSEDFSRPVTRIEMLKFAARLYGPSVTFPQSETKYADIPKENEASGIVNFASSKGIISPAAMFYPERTVRFEEAVKMIAMALEYGDYANLKGGYPNGYLAVASEIGLLEDVQAGEGNGITLVTAVRLLENALYSNVCNSSLIITSSGETQYYYDGATAGDSVLNKRFGVSKYGVFVNEVKNSTGQIKVEILSKDKKDAIAAYNPGDKPMLSIGEKASVSDIKYTYSDIYVNDKDEVVFAKVGRNIEVVTGHIYEVNKSHNKADLYPDFIKTIAFEDSEDYIDVAEDCIMDFDGKRTEKNASYSYIGAFARAVIYNDEIIALEAWHLTEGGIVTKVGDDDIQFIRGETTSAIVDDVTSYKDLTIFINGLKSELWALVSGTVVDYYASEDKETLIIVGSTRAITDEFETVSKTGITLGGDLYPLSEMYTVYYALKGEEYAAKQDLQGLMGRTVTAYIDYAGYVRYVRPVLDDELTKEYYAFVLGYEQQGLADPQFKVSVLQDGKVVEGTYELTENLIKNQSLLIENLKSEVDKILSASEEKKNEALKNAEIVCKIRVNDSGKIIGIRPAPKFEEPVLNQNYASGKNGYAVTDFSAAAIASTSSPKVYFDNSLICALYYNAEKGIVLKVVPWSDLKAKSGSGLWLSPFGESGFSEVEVLLLRGDVETIGHSRIEYIKSGLCTDVMIGYDAESDKEVLSIKVNDGTRTVSKYRPEFADVTDAAYIIYSDANPFLSAGEIKPIQLFNLSGDPDSWKLAEPRKVGLHRDELKKIDSRRAFFASGDVWYMTANTPAYELVEVNGKIRFVECSRETIPSGVDAWYVYYSNEIAALFYRK